MRKSSTCWHKYKIDSTFITNEGFGYIEKCIKCGKRHSYTMYYNDLNKNSCEKENKEKDKNE